MNREDLAKLASPQGRFLLASLPPYDPDLALTLSEGLRDRGLDPGLVAAALTQSRLRSRARTKFGEFTDGLLFTEAGLQQATRLPVAARHAARYRTAGLTRVADLTCGIGGDALAMAALGLEVTAIERDEETAALATLNLARFPTARVIGGDSLQLADTLDVDALWADPSRRTDTGRRVFDPAAYQPPLAGLTALARIKPIGIKVAPGIPHAQLPPGCEAQWTSDAGTVVECCLWFGPLRQAGAPEATDAPAWRTAIVGKTTHATPAPGDAPTTVALRDRDAPPLPTGPLDAYLLEPDGAVIRSGLIAEAGALVPGSHLVHPRIAYVTAPAPPAPGSPASALFTAFRVQDHFPFNLKKLRAYLRARDVGRLEILKRGTAVIPAELLKRLDLRGHAAATIILTRLGETQSVIVAHREP